MAAVIMVALRTHACMHADWEELLVGMVKGVGSAPVRALVERFGVKGIKEVRAHAPPLRAHRRSHRRA